MMSRVRIARLIDELLANVCDMERALQSETDPDKQNELSLEADGIRQEIQNLIRGSDFLEVPSKAGQPQPPAK